MTSYEIQGGGRMFPPVSREVNISMHMHKYTKRSLRDVLCFMKYRLDITVEPFYCGNLGYLVECPV